MATLRNHPNFWLRDDAAQAFNEAEADHGIFNVTSAGRHEWQQQFLIDRWNKGGIINRPPYLYEPKQPARLSNHVANGGAAVDLSDWRRFATICERYGFRHTYPGSDPVHFDFVGRGSVAGGTETGDFVVKLQQTWLASQSYNIGASGVDGIAGPAYAAAVQQYQTFLRAYGYTGDIDGQWGPGTQAAHEKYYEAVTNPKDQDLINRQNWLISRNYDIGTSGADGVWGPKTEAAIKQYQEFLKAFGYSGAVDGDWGPGTEDAHKRYVQSLVAEPGVPAYPLPDNQYFGPEAGGDNSVSGWHYPGGPGDPRLKQFQQRMADRGWPITVDGIYGPKGATTPQGNTSEVVIAFQKEKGLTADGLIGRSTWEAAWSTPVTPATPTPAPPVTEPPVPADDELAATPNLITPTAADFPSWIKYDVSLDPDGQKADLNKWAIEYYGVRYNPIEAHLHWWGLPGQAGSHDGNVGHLRNTKDLSTNFVTSAGRVTLMVPLNKIALTTGRRNPYGWKSENDPALTELGYKTLGFLVYIVEKLNPSLRSEALRLHKEFQATGCSEIDKSKVREIAEAFHAGRLDVGTGLPVVNPPEPEPTPEPTPDPVPNPDKIEVPKSVYELIKALPDEFRKLADEIDENLV